MAISPSPPRSSSKDAIHRDLVAWLWIGWACLGFVSAFLILVLLSVPWFEGDRFGLPRWDSPAGLFILVCFAAVLPVLAVGVGLLRKAKWARYLAFAISPFVMLTFPIGTALGIYTFWVLMRKERGS